MAKNDTTAYDPRQIWATNLAPLVTAAREGAVHAANTASKERARARLESRWWRSRWLVVAAAGLAVAGAAGGAYAVARRRSSTDQPTAATVDTGPTEDGDESATSTLKSTMDAGREKVSDLARAMRDKLRSGEPSPGEPASPLAPPAPDESRNQAPVAGGGIHRPF